MSFRINRDGIHSQIFETDEDPSRDEDVFETFRAARGRLLRYLRDGRDRFNDVIHRIEHTTERDLHGGK